MSALVSLETPYHGNKFYHTHLKIKFIHKYQKEKVVLSKTKDGV